MKMIITMLALASLAVGPCDDTPLGALGDGGASIPGACAAHQDYATCQSAPGCRWLAPGCGDQMRRLPAAGCFPIAEIDCATDPACPAGKRCDWHDIDPCYNPTPGGAACASCGQLVKICL
jgi:hypothetical protein